MIFNIMVSWRIRDAPIISH